MKRHIIILPALLLLASCATTSYIQIDTAQPATTNINYTFESPTVVVSKYLSDKEYSEDINKIMFDGEIVPSLKDQCANSFAQNAQYSLLVNNKEVNIVTAYRKMQGDTVPKLSNQFLDSIANKYNSDCIIGLDYFKPKMVIQTSKSTIKAMTIAVWRVYDMRRNIVINQKTVLDTVSLFIGDIDLWEFADIKAELLNKVDYRAYELGQEFAKNIMPFWKSESREIYSSGNLELSRAWSFAYSNEWEKASVIWLELSKKNDKNIRFYSLYNLAVAAEYFGSTKKANEYLDQAEKIKKNDITAKYRFILNKREKQIELLDKQMGL